MAGRFHRDVAPFSAVAEQSEEAWRDLGKLIGPEGRAILFAPKIETPAGWVAEMKFNVRQLVAGDLVEPRTDAQFVDLGADDVPEMIDLVDATRPGPFGDRTIALGRYFGYRVDGRLVAMAGERLKGEGFTEVSAVCTADDYRGRGLGSALTIAVAKHIRSRSAEAFLHVANDNESAYRLYLALGFEVRREVDVAILRQDL